jgi:tetratricopeptide (TPR) repeat protein
MLMSILIAVIFLAAGSALAFFNLSKPKKGKTGLHIARKKGGKKQKDNDSIVQAALKKLEEDPRNIEALLAVGEKYYSQQDWDKTYKTYKTLCDLPANQHGVDDFEIYFRCGLAAAKLGMANEALKTLIVAASFNDSDYRVQFELGNLNFLNGNYEKALTYLIKSRSLNPEYAPMFRVLGHTYFKLKKFKEAMVNIRKALDVMPGDKETLFTLAECYEESGQTDQASRIYSHLRADPEWGPAACLAVGLIRARAQNLDEALTDFEIGLKHTKIKSSIALELRYELALVCLKKKDIGKALDNLHVIKDTRPDYKNTETLIKQYGEVYANKNLQTYILSQPDEFLGLCRKMILSFYSKAKVKFMQTNVVGNEWADILAEIDTPRWSNIIGFRFFRTQGSVGELVVRDFHEHLKAVKADKGICFAAGQFTDEAIHFTEVRLIELIDRSRLPAHLSGADYITNPSQSNKTTSL